MWISDLSAILTAPSHFFLAVERSANCAAVLPRTLMHCQSRSHSHMRVCSLRNVGNSDQEKGVKVSPKSC